MPVKSEILFSNHWDVRISDPGLEGAVSNYFKTVYLDLVAHIENQKVRYEFTRKLEKEVQLHCTFTETHDLFKFLGDHLGPVSVGEIGIKIGKLGL